MRGTVTPAWTPSSLGVVAALLWHPKLGQVRDGGPQDVYVGVARKP